MAQPSPARNGAVTDEDDEHFVAIEATDAQVPMRCFKRCPPLSFEDSIHAVCSIGRAPDNRPDIKHIPDEDDAATLVKFFKREVEFAKQRPVVADLIRRCGLTDTDLCALMSIKIEDPFPLYRFMNAWLQGQRRDSLVRDKVGPLFTLVYRAMEKLPKVRVVAARAVIVNNIPALKRTFDNYKERLKPGMELSFWSSASFSTDDDVVNREEFVGDVREPAIVFVCADLEGVDMEPFKPRGLKTENEVLPLCPAAFRVLTAVKVGAKLVVSLAQDLQEHAEQAYVVPVAEPLASAAAPPPPPEVVKVKPQEQQNCALQQPPAAHVDPPAAAVNPPLPTPPQQQKQPLLSPRSTAIAAELRDTQRYPYSAHLATTRISTGTTYREAALALVGKGYGEAWSQLGDTVPSWERVTVNGRNMWKRDCYIEALTHDAKNTFAWSRLGAAIRAGETVMVNGRAMGQRDCYVEALTHDAQDSYSWYNLGCGMSGGVTVTVNGRSIGERDCFVEALTHGTQDPYAWCNLGCAMGAGERVTVNGRQMSQRDCYLEALTLDRTNKHAWNSLAKTFGFFPFENVTVNGERLSKKDCEKRGQ